MNRVLFISGRCDHCKNVLLGIQQHPFLKTIFSIVNIDTHPYPNYIKTVPSILINNQVVTGNQVFEYLGRIVESKSQQEERESTDTMTDQDKGVCRVSKEGELEGYCGGSINGMGFAPISEGNDDFTNGRPIIESNYDFLEGNNPTNTVYEQVQQLEKTDAKLNQKQQTFDNDYERLQQERGNLMQQQQQPMQGGPPPMR